MIWAHLPPDMALIVLGDHGMTLGGDHGGDTPAELDAALFLSRNRDGYNWSTPFQPGDVMEQLDFAASLSVLLDLPIPFSSLGYPHPAFIPLGTTQA